MAFFSVQLHDLGSLNDLPRKRPSGSDLVIDTEGKRRVLNGQEKVQESRGQT